MGERAVSDVPDGIVGASEAWAGVFDGVITNWFAGYEMEYDGRSAVSITRRVLFPG